MGYFYADKEIFEEVIIETGSNSCRHPLTYILEAADDIAYKTADIEDAFKKGLVNFEQLCEAFREEKYIHLKNDDKFKACETALSDLEELHNRAVKNNTNNPKLYAVQNWIIKLQGTLINCVTYSFTKNYTCIMEGTYPSDLFKDTYGQYLVEILGDISYKYAFSSKEILKLEIAASSILEFLLDKFVKAVLYYDTERKLSAMDRKLVDIISDNYKCIYKHYATDKTAEEKLYLRMLLVTDFISGMTDQYAKSLYQELNGIY